MKETPMLNLKGYGYVNAEILWVEGRLFKIKFVYISETKIEIFNISEILNYDEIFIDSELKITKYV